VAILFCGTRGLLSDIPVGKIKEFEREFIEFVNMKYPEILDAFKKGQISENAEETLTRTVREMTAKYTK